MKKIFLGVLLVLAAGIFSKADAQFTRYIVKFKDKGSNTHSLSAPGTFLTQRAIDRRTRYSIPLDSTDLPVTKRYLDSIRSVPNVIVLNVSKWLNQISIQTTDAAAITKINSFPFVETVAPIAARVAPVPVKDDKFGKEGEGRIMADFYSYGLSAGQVKIHNGDFLHNIGLRGQGMVIGMLDAGYFNYTTLKAFDSINANGQVLGTYDFVKSEVSVVEDHSHGMQCLSIIAANIPGQFVGTAPKANFYLYRTEDAATEYPIEEHNWVVGAERVDSLGGDVITSSLGYTTFDNATFNHTYADMNGNTTIAARGADLAAKKGILVLNAAGNDGNNAWKYIGTPADGDSVVAVGAVNVSGVPAGFSSYGPSSDGQVKPDVASVGQGTIIQYSNNTIGPGNGTSFACPNMAGLATCLWQGFQEVNNMRIVRVLREAGSKSTVPDTRVGYGIPDVRKATLILLKEFATASATAAGCNATISWTSKDVATMRYEIERRGPSEQSYTKVGERFGTGNVFSVHNYQFTDNTVPASGNYSYRIRQIVDTANTVGDYIDTVSLAVGGPCNTEGGNIFILNNPTRGIFSVRIAFTDAMPDLTINITDAVGKVVYSLQTSKPVGTYTVPITAWNLASGKYFVSVYNGNELLGTRTLLRLSPN